MEVLFHHGLSKSRIVKFPRYVSYSLEERFKPRYVIMNDEGVVLLLNQKLRFSLGYYASKKSSPRMRGKFVSSHLEKCY